jgi:hypothetical protein
VPLGVGASAELRQQPRLPDAGLADDEDRRRAAPIELGERSSERTELLRTPDEVVGLDAHFPFPRG